MVHDVLGGESGQTQGTVFRIFQKVIGFQGWMGCGRWITEGQQMDWMALCFGEYTREKERTIWSIYGKMYQEGTHNMEHLREDVSRRITTYREDGKYCHWDGVIQVVLVRLGKNSWFTS